MVTVQSNTPGCSRECRRVREKHPGTHGVLLARMRDVTGRADVIWSPIKEVANDSRIGFGSIPGLEGSEGGLRAMA